MHKVFIKVVNSNHQDCIDYLVSLGGKNWSNWRGNTCADSYCIKSNGDVGWTGKNGWRWCTANGYTEIFLPETTSKRHPHHDLIVQWASDISQKVWWSPDKSFWSKVERPTWVIGYHYFIGENPPLNLEPVLFEDACKDAVFYVANPTSTELYCQIKHFTEADKHLFDRKLVYYTPEGAIKRAKEMPGIDD